ncbi:AAA family ATPase [Microbacterium radiodurans]|uniref:AAA family ATPase n=1 Tax=Microbacterium radiodurans TaxID=661398 RepID=A0A5J5IVZ3_9MICO|nr:AAA family ATPase [Microbacterium radiodurans]KAA9087222.1 AAA family ATPase [Microbacterium radiodurans]
MRRIVKVRGANDAGILDGWSMSTSVEDFSRVNVIYGGNGSGKSTLARVLSQMTHADPTDVALQVDVDVPSGGSRRVVDRSDSFWSRLRVFDKRFVKKNLLFDVNGRSDALPLLVLGEPNVTRDKRLSEIDVRLGTLTDQLPAAKSAAEKATSTAKKLATDTARTIGQELQSAGGRYAARSYDARRVTELLTTLDQVTARRSDTEIATDLRLVQGQRMEPTALVQPVTFDLTALEAQVAALLGETITSIAIEELAGDAEAEQWVQQGLRLHAHRDACLFCANPLTAERRQALASHFDESFTKLQNRISVLDRTLEREHEEFSCALTSAPDRALLYADLQDAYQEQLRQSTEDAIAYWERITALRTLLEAKRSTPFSAVDAGDLPGRSAVSYLNLNEVLDQHNTRSADYQEAVTKAARRIELARLAEIADAHRESLTEGEQQTELADALKREQTQLTQERERINVADLDPSPLAAELTRDVASLLGRDELEFSQRDGRYSIQRNGHPATALSEGEQTAISLLYFLCSLRDEQTRKITATVVIDDPVSSLDQEILVGASSHLWSTLVGNGSTHQVILLTHSFELFRLWSNQLDRLPGNVKRDDCPYSIYELRARYENLPGGTSARRPVLLSWTDEKLRAKLRSQYHYLFWRIADVLDKDGVDGDLASELEATAIIPNAARQMLEAFLAFKYPSKIGDFEGSMRRAFQDQSVPDPLRQRVTRFVHRQSHNEEADISRPVKIGEAVTILRSAFEFISTVDRGHFDEMCAALDLDAAKLLALP